MKALAQLALAKQANKLLSYGPMLDSIGHS